MLYKRIIFVIKTDCISDNNFWYKTKTYENDFTSREENFDLLETLGRGAVFTPTKFLHLGTRAAIDKALSRMTYRGTVRRIATGLYDYPKTHPQLGLLAPSTDDIVASLAEASKLKIQPSGAYAANLLGLSEQVPMKAVFFTNGTPRRMRVGKREIILKRTTPRQMSTAGSISGLVIQALRHIGKLHLDTALLKRLSNRLSKEDKQKLLSDIENAPSWMAVHLNKLAQS